MRLLLRILVLALLAGYAAVAARAYLAERDPESFLDADSRIGVLLGPSAAAAADAGSERIDRALDALNDRARPGPQRLADYRRDLRVAQRLFERSLEADPLQARVVVRLVAVRWELDPAFTDAGVRPFLDAIALASRLAPRVTGVQLQIGDVLLRMGRRDEALGYLRRAVELDPETAPDAVRLLRAQLDPPGEILSDLPPVPEVLVALQDAYFEERDPAGYADAIEPRLPTASAVLIARFGNACIGARQPERLYAALDRLGPRPDPADEAERELQMSRALAGLDRAADAVALARRALARSGGDPRFDEWLGAALLQDDRPEEAARSFRAALARVARRSPDPKWRARLYREIGQAEEALGRPDRAYDAYRRAVDLVPDEPIASKRLEQMHSAAGVETPPPTR